MPEILPPRRDPEDGILSSIRQLDAHTICIYNRYAVFVHTETGDEIRVISFRKATKREQEILFENI